MRPFRRLLVLTALSHVTVAVLALERPPVAGGITRWSGDDLALATAWLLALVLSAWLAIVGTVGVLALVRRNERVALRMSRFAPAFVRRVVEAAVVVMCAVGPATAAHASPPTPRPPVVVHVNADGTIDVRRSGGRSAGEDRATTATTDQPVVRAPAPATSSAPPTTAAATAQGLPVPRADVSIAPRGQAPRERQVAVAPGQPASLGPMTRHVVQRGENLWSIARVTVTAAQRGPVTTERIAHYWRSVVAANRGTVRSGNPSLIFAGEVVALPPLPTD
jgi:hypothetical protein